jgi:hypothetical protein
MGHGQRRLQDGLRCRAFRGASVAPKALASPSPLMAIDHAATSPSKSRRAILRRSAASFCTALVGVRYRSPDGNNHGRVARGLQRTRVLMAVSGQVGRDLTRQDLPLPSARRSDRTRPAGSKRMPTSSASHRSTRAPLCTQTRPRGVRTSGPLGDYPFEKYRRPDALPSRALLQVLGRLRFNELTEWSPSLREL